MVHGTDENIQYEPESIHSTVQQERELYEIEKQVEKGECVSNAEEEERHDVVDCNYYYLKHYLWYCYRL